VSRLVILAHPAVPLRLLKRPARALSTASLEPSSTPVPARLASLVSRTTSPTRRVASLALPERTRRITERSVARLALMVRKPTRLVASASRATLADMRIPVLLTAWTAPLVPMLRITASHIVLVALVISTWVPRTVRPFATLHVALTAIATPHRTNASALLAGLASIATPTTSILALAILA